MCQAVRWGLLPCGRCRARAALVSWSALPHRPSPRLRSENGTLSRAGLHGTRHTHVRGCPRARAGQQHPRKAGYSLVQQQERSPGLATLAALSLVGWIALYGLLFWYAPSYVGSCSATNAFCGLGLLEPAYVLVGIGALIGLAASLGTMVRAVRRRDVLSALSIGLL